MTKNAQKREVSHEKAWALVLGLFVSLGFSRAGPRRTEFPPTAVEDGTHLEVQSKWGTKLFPSELDLNVTDGYSITIPLDSLKPPPPEPEEPTKPAGPAGPAGPADSGAPVPYQPRKPSNAPESEEEVEAKKCPTREAMRDEDDDDKEVPEKKEVGKERSKNIG